MFNIINTPAAWFASLALLVSVAVGSAAASGQETASPPPDSQQVSPAPIVSAHTPSAASPSSVMSDIECSNSRWSNCDCLHCRFNGWTIRNWIILQHDKRQFHSYIRGNGPAIHTRPAGIYWW